MNIVMTFEIISNMQYLNNVHALSKKRNTNNYEDKIVYRNRTV